MIYLLVASSLFAAPVSHTPSSRTGIPDNLHGVWTVVSATDNGTELPLPKNPTESLASGECEFLEIIVCKSRVVIVLNDGRAIVAKTRVLASKPQTKIEMVATRYHDKKQEPSFAILSSTNSNKIQFAFCPKESNIVNGKKGGKQIVLTATR